MKTKAQERMRDRRCATSIDMNMKWTSIYSVFAIMNYLCIGNIAHSTPHIHTDMHLNKLKWLRKMFLWYYKCFCNFNHLTLITTQTWWIGTFKLSNSFVLYHYWFENLHGNSTICPWLKSDLSSETLYQVLE